MCSKQKIIQSSPFKAHFERLPKTEFKILRDKFSVKSDHIDKENLERLALTASQLKKRIDQKIDNVKIVPKGQKNCDVSTLFKHQVQSANRGRALKTLLEANARWNTTRSITSASNIRRRIVDETSTINLELIKELLYSWEHGLIEDKPQEQSKKFSQIFLRK